MEMELWKLVADVDDITEPSCMEKILAHLDYLQTQDEEFMELLVDRLAGEVVHWSQPWYQRIARLTRRLENQREEEQQFRTDALCKLERELIAKNWKKLRKTFDLPNTPECFARWKNRNQSRHPQTQVEKVRNYVTAYLARGLERNLNQVYLYFVAQYGAPVRGAYSKTEEKIMDIFFHHNPKNAITMCATVLGRESRGIYKRFKEFNFGKPEKKKVKWDLKKATKLLNSLMKHSELPLQRLKYTQFDMPVWLKVQEDMDHQYIYLYRFWYDSLHVQLFVKCDLKLSSFRKQVLKKLRSRYTVWTDIRWKDLVPLCPDGITPRFIYRAIRTLVYDYPEGYRKASLNDVIEFAFARLNRIKKRRKERRLKTLVLNKEGDLEVVKYDKASVT